MCIYYKIDKFWTKIYSIFFKQIFKRAIEHPQLLLFFTIKNNFKKTKNFQYISYFLFLKLKNCNIFFI